MGCVPRVYPRSASRPPDRPVAYPSPVSLYTLDDSHDLIEPVLIAAFDGWVDAGSAATTALAILADDGDVGRDLRRRPAVRLPGSPAAARDRRRAPDRADLAELVLRRTRLDERDLLVLVGPEPDYRWRAFTADMIDLAGRLGVAAVDQPRGDPGGRPAHPPGADHRAPRRRPASCAARSPPGPAGTLRVPSALVSALEIEVAAAGIPALGYFAQVPHYVSGPYATAALELLRALGNHLGADDPGRRAGARRHASCGRGSTRRPASTRRRAATSSGSRRCTTSSACRRATT